MLKTSLLLLLLLIVSSLIIGSLGYAIFPVDISNYLPSLSLDHWSRVHNSLLADPFFQFEPWRIYAKSRLLQGEIPFWNPYNGGGVPFLANPQAAVFYPLNILYYFLPVSFSLNLIPLSKAVLMVFFSYLYIKTIVSSKLIQFFGSFLAFFAGFPVMWLLWPHTNVFILFPLLLFVTEKLRIGINTHRYLLLVSLIYFVGILGGHPETLFHAGVLHFFYSLARLTRTVFLKQALFIGLGFFLGSFMLLPFIEYVLNSSLVSSRFQSPPEYYLPFVGMIYNVFPLILGAPHLAFYRQLADGVNFQELTGGYIGLLPLLFAIVGAIKYKKILLIRLVAVLLVFQIGIVYRIWPFFLLTKLPIVSAVANHRFIGFAGFFLVVLLLLVLDRLDFKVFSDSIYKKLTFLIAAFSVAAIPLILVSNNIASSLFPSQIGKYIPFFFSYFTLFIFLHIVVVYLLVFIHKRQMRRLFLATILLFSCLGNITLFLGYNSIQKIAGYYPENEFITKLQELPRGNVMQVGNMNFPPNVNLAYGLANVQSDDAIGISDYQTQFKKSFPVKNFKKIVDEVSIQQLRSMNVSYVVSDYNLNLKKENLYKETKKLIPLSNIPTKIMLTGNNRILSQIRILTANYNRLNSCKLFVVLKSNNKRVVNKVIDCGKIKDNSFVAIDIDDIKLVKGQNYELEFYLNTVNDGNNVALRGGKEPYLDLLYKNKGGFEKIWDKEGVIIWHVPETDFIDGVEYTMLQDDPESVSAILKAGDLTKVTVRKTKYPGWNVYLDNKKIKIEKGHFTSFQIQKGEHLLQIKYEPFSFKIGLFISVVTFIGLLIFLMRSKEVQAEIYRYSKILRKISVLVLVKIVIISTIVSGFALGCVALVGIKFAFKTQDGINWYTVNNYPRQQDQFYFSLSTILFLSLPLLSLFLYLCKIYLKKKK